MIIGFTEQIRYVSEGQEGAVDLFQLQIEVNSVRTAEDGIEWNSVSWRAVLMLPLRH